VAEGADHETLIREGVALRRAGDDLGALSRFQQAYELNKTPRALAQIGLAEQALGRWAAADRHLRQALESADDPWIRKNRASIDESLAAIGGHVGQLEVSGTPVGAEVRVDGELVGQLPLPRPITVTAGGVAVDVRAPGYVPIVRAATITARTLTRESFNLQSLGGSVAQGPVASADSPTATTTPPPLTGADANAAGGSPGPSDSPPPATDEAPRRRIFVLAAGGLAVASLAFGIIEHVRWQGKVDSFGSMSACDAKLAGRGGPGCNKLYEDGSSARTLAFVGYGLGAAFAATAAILYFTDRRGGGSEPPKLACAPLLTTSQVGCAMTF
jgi:hypothetical protein